MNKENKKDLYCIGSGILISFGIAFSVVSAPLIAEHSFYVLGIFAGGLFIGIGLLPFKKAMKI